MSVEALLAVVFNTTMVAVLLYAFTRGGRPERLGVAINVAGFVSTTGLRLLYATAAWAPGNLPTLIVDLGVAASFFWLAVTTTRFWPIWAAGFALANLFMTFFGALLPGIPLFAYHTGLGIYAYLALGALALGTLRLPRDAAAHLRNGSRRSWLQHQRSMNS